MRGMGGTIKAPLPGVADRGAAKGTSTIHSYYSTSIQKCKMEALHGQRTKPLQILWRDHRGRGIRCAGELVHDDCLDDIQDPENELKYMNAYPNTLLEFLREHRADDFLNEFWGVFWDENMVDIERWSVS